MHLKNTKKYVEAFNQRNIDSLADLMANNFILDDPINGKIEGKSQALEAIENLFARFSNLSFVVRNTFESGDTVLLEFLMSFDEKNVKGMDIIQWNSDLKMKELRVYLNMPKK